MLARNDEISVSSQLSDRMNYWIKHPIITLQKYSGWDFQQLASHFKETQKLLQGLHPLIS